MEPITNEPRSLTFSTRLYGALLAVYPSGFRRAYGSPMQQLFRDCCRRALVEAGLAGLLALWGRTMLDTVQAALEEHVQRGVDMSKEKFINLSGWALMLCGPVLVLGWLAGSRPEYSQYNLRSLPIDRVANAATGPLMILMMFLLAIGFTGLFLRYGQAAGSFGRASLGMGVLGGIVGVVGVIGLSIADEELWWSITMIGFTAEFLGLALFGLANLRQRVMPRGNILPLLTGIWIPLYILAHLIIEQASGRSWVEFPALVDASLFVVTTVGLVILGYVLQREPAAQVVTSPASA